MNNVRYSSINPALVVYTSSDVYINQPTKYMGGSHIISPSPIIHPWEEHLENGMPNVVVDNEGNTSIYISSFIGYRREGGSKVGAMVYVNKSSNLNLWSRPDAGLYWYKDAGTTPDEKIVSSKVPGSIATNIVAVDIESVGLLEENINGKSIMNWVYLPQRQSKGDLLAAYQMDKSFNNQGVLQGFAKMKQDRLIKESLLRFRYINGGTHLNLYKKDGKYYVNARLNTKRSELKQGEIPPFKPWDPRKRFRRELIAEIGGQIKTSNLEYEVALDMSNLLWEPYSLQSFQLPGFENDIQWGIVTMYGTDYNPTVEMIQRTELAFSVDGKHWKYVKPGEPFLDNGTNPQSDDFGCINMGKPIMGTKFFNDPKKLLYFYASSNIRHIITRQTGISLATGDFGKLAGLKSKQVKYFLSVNPKSNPIVNTTDMITMIPSKVFQLGKVHYPYVLADITQDPRGKKITDLNSYVQISFYAYDAGAIAGKGKKLISVLGSSEQGTQKPSSEYECVPVYEGDKDMTDKERVLEYIRNYSKMHPTEIIDFNTMPAIPVIIETVIKDATFYGIEFKNATQTKDMAIDLTNSSNINKQNLWEYKPDITVAGICQSYDFSNSENIPNLSTPVDLRKGAFALRVNPSASNVDQIIMKMAGDDYNYITVSFLKNGSFQFLIMKDSLPYNKLEIAPPSGKSFVGKSIQLTIEGTPQRFRKYLKSNKEDAAVMRVKVEELNFEKIVDEPYIWNWNHNPGEITSGDSTVARTAGYVPFTSFIAGMNTLYIGGTRSCENSFKGTIEQIEISDGLPTGNSDFWHSSSLRISSITETANIMSEENQSIFVYPNPVSKNERLHIQNKSALDGVASILIYDMTGRLKTSIKRKFFNNGVVDCDISNLSNGFHIVKIIFGNIEESKKILVIQ